MIYRPPVGTVIDGDVLRMTPWEPGTVIRTAEVWNNVTFPQVHFMLDKDGLWYSSRTGSLFSSYEAPAGEFDLTVVYLP